MTVLVVYQTQDDSFTRNDQKGTEFADALRNGCPNDEFQTHTQPPGSSEVLVLSEDRGGSFGRGQFAASRTGR
jgi:hypothetical protein